MLGCTIRAVVSRYVRPVGITIAPGTISSLCCTQQRALHTQAERRQQSFSCYPLAFKVAEMPVQALHTRQRLAPALRSLDVATHVHTGQARCRRRHSMIKATLNTTVKQLKSIIDPQTVKGQSCDFANANFPVDQEGRTLHLGCKRGEVANRILSVGSMDRALIIADQLQGAEPGAPLFQHLSGRGFLTITGLYQGTPVSIVTTLMGMPNMDFVVREARAVVDGQMAIVRLGTCGALRLPAQLGTFIVASPGAVCVRRDPDAWTVGNGRPHYTVSAPVAADPQLVQLLVSACKQHAGAQGVVEGLDATADSFYSSQGRTGGHFEDVNEAVIEQLMAQHSELVSLEMETFHLLDLARCSKGSIKAAAFCIAAAERYSNRFISAEQIQRCERLGGVAALTALTQCSLTAAVGADGSMISSAGSSSSSNGNGNGNGKLPALPADGYVWVQQRPVAAAVEA